MNQLKEKFKKEIAQKLKKELNLDNDMSVPTLEKIVINAGLGEVVANKEALEQMKNDLTLITGQKPIVTKAKRAISNFKIRIGQEIGLKVTLRGNRMWDFFQNLVSIVLPRIKDFRGVSRKSFDGFGNYSLGISDHTVFYEIDTNKITKIRSFQIIIANTAKDNKQGLKLLEALGMPFTKEEDAKMMEKMQDSLRREKKEIAKMKAKRLAEGRKIEKRRSADAE